MNERIDDLLSDWLEDANQNPASERDLSSGEESESIAESLLVHGLLADIGRRNDDQETERITAVMRRIDSECESKIVGIRGSNEPRRRRFAFLTSALTIAAAVVVMFAVFGPQQSVSAAMASLEKVVEAAAKSFDRTYNVSVVEEYSREKRPRNLSQEAWERETRKQLDGATLYVRSANQHVLTVMLESGEKRTSGCDGIQSWAFRENGPVHTSTDINRFRGSVPGGQQEIPFLNIHAHLLQLRTGYDVQLSDKQQELGNRKLLSQLIGVRKSRDVRGPKRVEIWFDTVTGTVHEMLLDGLPRGGGGPKSVLLKLVDQSDLPADFFSHESHHESERRVIRD
ncbi:MAG: hypothetical protein AAGJ40_07590 [Planctomycetota bacterium]